MAKERKIRIAVLTPRTGYRKLVLLARRKRISLAEYVRRALEVQARQDGMEVDLTVLPPRGGVSITDNDESEGQDD
jgi:hypothetical protein